MDAASDLYTLTLADGLPATSEGRELRYKRVHLRETNVADERMAQRLAERVVTIDGAPRLLVSDADFRYALTMRHIAAFECDGVRIPQPMIDLELLGKLTSHDLGLIEKRVFLITLAAEVRYGNISQADFDALISGKPPATAPAAPQPSGQAAAVGSAPADPQPGPALLADFAGAAAQGPAAGDAR